MILILSNERDAHVPYVTRQLEALDAEYFCFDPATFPSEARVDVGFGPEGQTARRLHHRGQTLDLDDITAVWYRRPGVPQAAPEVESEEVRYWVADEASHLLIGLWRALDCLWVPGRFDDLFAAEAKTRQLELAARLGFCIPRTLVTNDPRRFLEFYEECEGRVITKVLKAGLVRGPDGARSMYARVVGRGDVARYQAVRYAPFIAQAYVPKAQDVRVTVVGSRIFAVAIHSQGRRASSHDWRRSDAAHLPHVPHRLPLAIEALCLGLVQGLDLCFGAIDLALTPDGEYVFFEINPNGQWGWVEELTGLPIAAALAGLLAGGSDGWARARTHVASP